MINESQEIIIKKAKTPAAIIAGPGTGKTFTIVEKVIYLIKNENINPNNILITTFTKKAANELITRIEERLNKENINIDTSNMKIGNFHSLSLNFLKEYKSFDKKVFSNQVIDSYMEGYLIEKNLAIYKNIKNFDKYINFNPVKNIREIFEDITNNLIDLETLKNSENEKDNLAYEIYKRHEKFLEDNNLYNYQMILKKFYELLSNPYYGEKIRKKIDYVIIDEYQDTNYIQEEISFLLVKNNNIMVFGDDSQALYSFRGADPSNLLDFDKICEKKLGKKANFYNLSINYRSNQSILDFSNKWINREDIWRDYPKKDLQSFEKNTNDNSLVVARSENFSNLVKIIRILNEKINLNQMAFLFPTLNSDYPKRLQEFFEQEGINVLNKNSASFFYRQEIRLCMYILLNVFSVRPKSKSGSAKNSYKKRQQTEFKSYIYDIFEDESFKNDKEIELFLGQIKEDMKDLSYSSLLFRSFKLKKFQEILWQKLSNLFEIRSQTNIGKFTKILADYENLYIGEDISYQKQAVDLFYSYIFYLFKNRAVSEFDDFDTPEDAINFMTIHQAKGLEFDLVFVSGLNDSPRGDKKSFLEEYKRYKFDYNSKIRDFYRKYFTAFTRAKKLCVLLDNSKDERIRKFQETLAKSSQLFSIDFLKKDLERKKEIFAYTTDISIYETCKLKYKFLRKVKIVSPLTKELIFGTRVHELAEYIAYIKKENESIGLINDFLAKNVDYYKVIDNFIKRDFKIAKTEANYKADRDFYILQGNIDIVLDDDSIIDIKTGKKDDKLIENYRKQILSYYNLMKLNYKNPSHIYLYYIEDDILLEFEKDDFDIKIIDQISKSIIDGDIYEKTTNKEVCKFCPMKYFCKRD